MLVLDVRDCASLFYLSQGRYFALSAGQEVTDWRVGQLNDRSRPNALYLCVMSPIPISIS